MATLKATEVQRSLRRFRNSKRAHVMAGFFKTGTGEYGEGDVFIGAAVPHIRAVVKRFRELPLVQTRTLLRSRVHEDRLAAVLILNELYKRGTAGQRQKIYETYLANTRCINSWDIIDSSAPHIVGRHLLATASHSQRLAVLRRLARSRVLWDRRISILATQAFIRAGEFADTLSIATVLLTDRHDLIHKAVGWMLREVGERERAIEERFLRAHAAHMPRTMLRYAIEKFPAATRKRYLTQKQPA
ncbi:MAG: DNA alkylation repair protein [Candidatus Andersenbacteria bacterium]